MSHVFTPPQSTFILIAFSVSLCSALHTPAPASHSRIFHTRVLLRVFPLTPAPPTRGGGLIRVIFTRPSVCRSTIRGSKSFRPFSFSLRISLSRLHPGSPARAGSIYPVTISPRRVVYSLIKGGQKKYRRLLLSANDRMIR